MNEDLSLRFVVNQNPNSSNVFESACKVFKLSTNKGIELTCEILDPISSNCSNRHERISKIGVTPTTRRRIATVDFNAEFRSSISFPLSVSLLSVLHLALFLSLHLRLNCPKSFYIAWLAAGTPTNCSCTEEKSRCSTTSFGVTVFLDS